MDPANAWFDLWWKMLSAGLSASPGATPLEAAREVRSATLDAWGQAWERFLRSNEFLEAMKQAVGANVQFRRQLNDFFAQVHHEFQGPNQQDFDYLAGVLKRIERSVQDGFDRLERRIDELSGAGMAKS